MGVFRSYFSKSNTILKDNKINSSENPVTEIFYGGDDAYISRFIFDIDLDPLIERIKNKKINPNKIVSHRLFLINTINHYSKYRKRDTYSSNIERASSFELNLFNIKEDWDQGRGYDIVIPTTIRGLYDFSTSPSNWFERKTDFTWGTPGIYSSGVTETLGTQYFDFGNENLCVDLTDYVNQRLINEGVSFDGFYETIFSGTTTTGIGLKHSNNLEDMKTDRIQSVAFHTNNTHTMFVPYVETVFDAEVVDDRNYFILDKENHLTFSLNKENVEILGVTVNDYKNKFYEEFDANNVEYFGNGVYGIKLTIFSNQYPDCVLFNDVWTYSVNNEIYTKKNRFYLISPEDYFFNNNINLDNYHVILNGVLQEEKIKSGEIRKIHVDLKKLYGVSENTHPLHFFYRIYTKIDKNNNYELLPLTKVNKINNNYYFFLDTKWLLPNDYYLEILLTNNIQTKTLKTIKFFVY